MAQMPRWYRKQCYEHKLSSVLNNPLADVSQVATAKRAIEVKLDQDDEKYQKYQRNQVSDYLKKI